MACGTSDPLTRNGNPGYGSERLSPNHTGPPVEFPHIFFFFFACKLHKAVDLSIYPGLQHLLYCDDSVLDACPFVGWGAPKKEGARVKNLVNAGDMRLRFYPWLERS